MEIKLEEIFQDKIDQEIKIEPRDWMPEKYRKTLLRQIQRKGSRVIQAVSSRITRTD